MSYIVDIDLLHFSTVFGTRLFDSLSQLIDEQRISLKRCIERELPLDACVCLYFELSEIEEIGHDDDAFVFVSSDFGTFFPVQEILHQLLFALLVDFLSFAFQIRIECSFHFELGSFDVNLRRTNLGFIEKIDTQPNGLRLKRERRRVRG